MVDVIARKRDGHALSRDEIDLFVGGVTTGACPDYQASALLMAIVLRGMTADETGWLTEAMLRSGERLDLSDVPGAKVGKHSTGGVGDKVTIALAPLAAACGVVVPKMSGRGLGHTGGTLDKLEAIPGMRLDLSVEEFRRVLADVGTCIVGQSGRLAPADKILYALRDATATVPSPALIAASVMSKKLAEGCDALVLDVKCGDGAFVTGRAEALALARLLVEIGRRAGVRTEAVITRMDEPLGRAVGNALEIAECCDVLRGQGPPALTDLVVRLTSRVVALGRGVDMSAAEHQVQAALASGAGLERLRRMVVAQGGDPRVVDDTGRLPQAAHRRAVVADRAGIVARLRASVVGHVSMMLGAGRAKVGDAIDHAAGVLVRRQVGERVDRGDAVLELVYNDPRRADEAERLARDAFSVTDESPEAAPLVLDILS